MERINQHAGEMIPAFREAKKAPEATTEAALLVLTADGKGVPIRHAKDVARIADQKLTSGPKPDRKRMAVVGAAYTIESCASGEVSPKTSSASFDGDSYEQLAKLNISPNSNGTSFVNISETGALVKPASP